MALSHWINGKSKSYLNGSVLFLAFNRSFRPVTQSGFRFHNFFDGYQLIWQETQTQMQVRGIETLLFRIWYEVAVVFWAYLTPTPYIKIDFKVFLEDKNRWNENKSFTSCARKRKRASSTASFLVVSVLSLSDVRRTDCALHALLLLVPNCWKIENKHVIWWVDVQVTCVNEKICMSPKLRRCYWSWKIMEKMSSISFCPNRRILLCQSYKFRLWWTEM